jgi:hypothetical protein
MRLGCIVFAIAGILANAAISYGFARAGEPQAYWIWCEKAGLCA